MFCPTPQESVNNKLYLNMYFELIYDLEISTVKKIQAVTTILCCISRQERMVVRQPNQLLYPFT